MQKMSVRKQRIAKRLEVLGMVFDGQKVAGKYTIGIVTFKTLDEIEAYIKSLEQAKEQQNVTEAVVEPVKSAENWLDWENAMKPNKKLHKVSKERTIQMFDIRDVKRIFQSNVVYTNILDNGCPRIHRRKDIYVMLEVDDEYLVPWSNAKVGDQLNTAIGDDCSLCPEESQYKIKAGCFVKGRPCCQWCAHTDELGEKYMSGEISPMSPEDIAKQSGVCSKRTKK